MVHDEICVCGHPQSLHRTYGCNGPHPNPDPQKPTVSSVSAKHFKNRKLLTVKVWAGYSDGSACSRKGSSAEDSSGRKQLAGLSL
jgi:hypothetical protein